MTAGTSSGRTQSAVLIPVREAEPVVHPYRLEYDPVAAAGVPAHITLIVPWLPPEEIGTVDLDELADALRPTEAVRVPALPGLLVREVGAVAGARAGRAVLSAWCTCWPSGSGHPPYDDEFDEVVPHLTVGHATDGVELRPVAEELGAQLPIRCRAEEVWVMVGDGQTWSVRQKLPLVGP